MSVRSGTPRPLAEIGAYMNVLPFVRWDRCAGDEDGFVVYGWIDREKDGRSDFALLTFVGPTLVGFTTSSAKHSEEVHRLLGISGTHEHEACQRVADVFGGAIVRRVEAVTANTEGLVSHAHGATARQAAKLVKPRTGSQRWKVLSVVLSMGNYGQTRDQLTEATGLGPNSIRPRVKELLDQGYLEVASGRTRMNAQGSHVEVLTATDKGRDLVRPR